MTARTPAKRTPAKRIPRGTTTAPTAPTAPAITGPQPVEYDGQQVVFSFTQKLQAQGLLEHKPVEIGGTIYNFRATASTTDNAKLIEHMQNGRYRESIELMLDDPTQLDDVLANLRVPFDMAAEQQLWREFVAAISGVNLGELSAS